MFLNVICGHLGANAELRQQDGRQYVTFRVADTRRYIRNGQPVEETTWFSCIMNGDAGKLLQYLVKGQMVLVVGEGSTRIYSSPKLHRMVASVDVNVRTIELLGRPSEELPRQLADASGLLHNVYKAHFIPVQEAQAILAGKQSELLYDAKGNSYTLIEGGWVQPNTQPAETEDAAPADEVDAAPALSDSSTQVNDGAPFTGDAASEAVAAANAPKKRNGNKKQ